MSSGEERSGPWARFCGLRLHRQAALLRLAAAGLLAGRSGPSRQLPGLVPGGKVVSLLPRPLEYPREAYRWTCGPQPGGQIGRAHV